MHELTDEPILDSPWLEGICTLTALTVCLGQNRASSNAVTLTPTHPRRLRLDPDAYKDRG